MAEAYARKRFKEEALDIEVRSAGTLGIDGKLPTPETLKVIEDAGIDTKGYESTSLTKDLIDWADLILVMEPEHKNIATAMLPEANGRVRYLGEFKKPEEIRGAVILDPIGKPLAFYRVLFSVIKNHIEELIKWLKA